MSIKRDIELLFEIGFFRLIKRSWQRFLVPNTANNAEHSFRVAWIALVLATHEKTGNHEKILKMALVHDLPESRCGDVDYISREYTKRKESDAIVDSLKETIFGEEIVEIWNEYEKRESIEAKIVKDADNLDVELELGELKEQGSSLKEVWKADRRKMVYPKLYTDSAEKMWDEIETANPHDWHLMGKNRFNSGDWKISDKK